MISPHSCVGVGPLPPSITTATTSQHLNKMTVFYKHPTLTAQSISNCLHGADVIYLQMNHFIAK